MSHPALPWLQLQSLKGLGVATARALADHFGDAAAVLAADDEALAAAGATPAVRRALAEPPSAMAAELEWARADDCHIVTWADTAYPRLLRELPDAPLALFVRGDPEVLGRPQLAVVGSRNPTPTGAETAADFAATLARSGLVITSGMALGIDAAGHEGALAAGTPTIAVMGTGPDRIYPARHRDLAHAIVAGGGALVSEFLIGTPPRRHHFPRRNRLISGLALGTLVVEAAPRSGSLITAREALDQGREVFAVPGSIHNPLARGCHGLIRDGAKLVEAAADILEELGPLAALHRPDPPPPEPATGSAVQMDEDALRVLENLGHEPQSVDRVVERTGLTPETVSSILLVLELQGYVASAPGGLFSRVAERKQ